MTPVHTSYIDHPSAWMARDVGGKVGLTRDLEPAHIEAIESLLRRVRGIPFQRITRQDFDHPALNAWLAELREVIMNGRGIAVIRGIAAARYDLGDLERIYWGFGTHLGIAVEQSAKGDRLGYVENGADDGRQRGYRSLQELRMHTDSYEVVGLMGVRSAKSGGLSGMASSLAVHNEILRTRPELLVPLYRGYRYASGEAKFSSKAVTDEAIPIFSVTQGLVSCTYERLHIDAAAVTLGEPLPDDLVEAMNYFDQLAGRPDIAASFLLEPGEMLLFHNYTNLHSRTAFEDAPDRKRLLLRLWLDVPGGRPADPSLSVRADTYRRIYAEAAIERDKSALAPPTTTRHEEMQ